MAAGAAPAFAEAVRSVLAARCGAGRSAVRAYRPMDAMPARIDVRIFAASRIVVRSRLRCCRLGRGRRKWRGKRQERECEHARQFHDCTPPVSEHHKEAPRSELSQAYFGGMGSADHPTSEARYWSCDAWSASSAASAACPAASSALLRRHDATDVDSALYEHDAFTLKGQAELIDAVTRDCLIRHAWPLYWKRPWFAEPGVPYSS